MPPSEGQAWVAYSPKGRTYPATAVESASGRWQITVADEDDETYAPGTWAFWPEDADAPE